MPQPEEQNRRVVRVDALMTFTHSIARRSSSLVGSPSIIGLDGSVVSGCGPDVLIHPKQVLWIELGLERREPRIVRAVGLAHCLRALVLAERVHVHGPARPWTNRLPAVADPADVLRILLGLVPLTQNEEVLARVRVVVRGRGSGDTACRATVVLEHRRRQRRRA